MHFAFVYFVNNRYDKRIPLIKWLIVISKRIVSSRSFSVPMFFSQSPSLHFSLVLSLSLSLSSLSKPFESRSLHKWYTIIDHKYFIFRGIVYCSTHVWQLYASGVWEEEKQRCQWILQTYHSIVQDNTRLEFVIMILWNAQVIEDTNYPLVTLINALFWYSSKLWQ